jgi:hypothetical protein
MTYVILWSGLTCSTISTDFSITVEHDPEALRTADVDRLDAVILALGRSARDGLAPRGRDGS